jgi:hypothetical protein
MSIRAALAAVLVLGLGSVADAGVFGGEPNRPRAVDSPSVRPKIDYGHKAGYSFKGHPEKVRRPEWGNEWKRLKRIQGPSRSHYLYR